MYSWVSLVLLVAAMHPLHLSFVNISIDKSGEIELVIKLFSDDLDSVLLAEYGQDSNFQLAPIDVAENLAAKYVQAKLRLYADGDLVVWKYSRFDSKNDATWFYFTAKAAANTGKWRMMNTLMLGLYKDQKNLLILEQNGQQRPMRFSYDKREQKW